MVSVKSGALINNTIEARQTLAPVIRSHVSPIVAFLVLGSVALVADILCIALLVYSITNVTVRKLHSGQTISACRVIYWELK